MARSQDDLAGSASNLTPSFGDSVATKRIVADANVTVRW